MAYDPKLLITSPIDLQLTDTGDLYIGPNGTTFTSGLLGVAQAVSIRLKLFLNEWFLNLDAGIDWNAILGEKYDSDFVRSEITREILATPGIVSVTTLSFTLDSNRQLSVTWSAKSQFGDTLPDTVGVQLV